MRTPLGQLTYCTNIHPGEHWPEHFAQLQQYIPAIKKEVAADQPFGIGLRLSHVASLELQQEENLSDFQSWLQQQQCFVFTINGFPYGGFHHTRVKDNVHVPDWTTTERSDYTIRLAQILSVLLPEGMEGGISTSPLSYKYWHEQDRLDEVKEKATQQVLNVVEQLIQIKQTTGKFIHLDIEPEPDGLLESGPEFLHWYVQKLLPMGIPFLQQRFSFSETEAEEALKDHVQLCYDVCHFAIGFENHKYMVEELKAKNIRVGKIQISAALKAVLLPEVEKRKPVMEAFERFNESTYLHQVVAQKKDGTQIRYRDLPDALNDAERNEVTQWRAHFHVPLFIHDYGLLQSTQQDIVEVLSLQSQQPFTQHLEIETYTWDVLPPELKVPMKESIVRELQWVLKVVNGEW